MDNSNVQTRNIFTAASRSSGTDRFTPVQNPTLLEVTIGDSPVDKQLGESLYRALNVRISSPLPESLSGKRLAEMVNALIFLRVCYVNGQPVKDPHPLAPDQLRFPALLAPLLLGVGLINDDNEHIYVNEVKYNGSLRLTKSEASHAGWQGRVMETLEDCWAWGTKLGLEMFHGMPATREGNLGVYSLEVHEGRIGSGRPGVHAEEVLIRSCLDLKVTPQVFGPPRFGYESVGVYRQILCRHVEFGFK